MGLRDAIMGHAMVGYDISTSVFIKTVCVEVSELEMFTVMSATGAGVV